MEKKVCLIRSRSVEMLQEDELIVRDHTWYGLYKETQEVHRVKQLMDEWDKFGRTCVLRIYACVCCCPTLNEVIDQSSYFAGKK